MEYIPQCTLTGKYHPNELFSAALQFVCAFTPNTEQSLAWFFVVMNKFAHF